MSKLNVSLSINAKTGKLIGKLKKVISEVDKLGSTAEKSGKRANKGYTKTAQGLRSISQQLSSTKKELIALFSVRGAANLVGQLSGVADEVTNMNAQLRLVTQSNDQFNQAQREVFDIAQQTRSGLQATNTLYARMSRSLKAMGEDTNLAAGLTKTLNQTMIISGASAQESQAAIIQLSQGLQSGVLRGDEFNSVMEQAPRLAQAMADSLHVNTGELRQMAQNGELTADKVVKALVDQRQAVDIEYGSMQITIGQAWTKITNSITRYIGQADNANKISSDIASTISGLSEKIGYLDVAIGDVIQFFENWKTTATGLNAEVSHTGLFLDSLRNQLGDFAGDLYNRFITLPQNIRAGITQIIGFFDRMMIQLKSDWAQLSNNANIAWLSIKSGAVAAAGLVRTIFAEALAKVLDAVAKVTQKMADLAGKAGLNKLSKQLNDYTNKLRKSAGVELEVGAAMKKKVDAINSEIEALKTSNTEIQNRSDTQVQASLDATQAAVDEASAATSQAIAQHNANTAIAEGSSALTEHTVNLKNAATGTKALDKTSQDFNKSILKLLNDIERSNVDALSEDMLKLEIALEEANSAAVKDEAYIRRLTEAYLLLAESMNAVESPDLGLYGNGNNTLGDLFEFSVQKGFASADLNQFFTTFEQGIKKAWENNAPELANQVISFANLALDSWEANSGKDSAGQVASTINDIAASGALGPVAQAISAAVTFVDRIFGGKLLGTKWQGDGSGFGVSLGSQGFDGQQWQRQVRQRSFFRGRQWNTDTNPLDDQAINQLNQLFDGINNAIEESARLLGVQAGDLIVGSFEQEFDADGNLVKQTSEVLGRFYEETLQQFGTRLTAENIIAQVGQTTGQVETTQQVTQQFYEDGGRALFEFTRTMTVMTNEADAIAERWRGDADLLLEGSQLLLLAQSNILKGNGLLGDASLTATVDFVEGLNRAGETLNETFVRLSTGADILTEALNITGTNLDLTRQEFVTFAADIADAAGGLQQAASLWKDYFAEFYSPEELLAQNIAQAGTNRTNELQDIGLNSDITNEQFRQLFEQALPSLTADQVVQWLEAARAMGVYNDLLDQQNQTLDDADTTLLEAKTKYKDFIGGISSELSQLNSTDFQNALVSIQEEERQNILTANELARAAGLQGAAEEDLARIHSLAAAKAAQAIAQLQGQVNDLIGQLYGTPLTDLEDQISELENTQTTAIGNVGNAANNMYEDQVRAIKRISGFIDNLLLNDSLTTLTPEQQLAEAQRQYNDLLNRAQSGDTEALNALPDAANSLLDIARGFYASGDQYTAIFDGVVGALSDLGVTASPGGGGGNVGGGGAVGGGVSPELQALYDQRDALLAEQEAQNRLELATQLTTHLRDLAQALDTPILDLAQSMGVEISALVTDLGVNLDDLSASTVSTLANISNGLGVNLTELADAVGIDLGNLADDQSLLNDALEESISGLPEEYSNLIGPLLENLETATTATDANQALSDLEQVTGGLPVEYRNLLAPYFDDIDPISELQNQIGIADSQLTQLQNQSGYLRDILDELRNTTSNPEGNSLPSYDVGTSYVGGDQVAQIHNGEMILDAQAAGYLRNYGIKVQGGSGGDSSAVVNKLAAIEQRLASIEQISADNGGRLDGIKDEVGVVGTGIDNQTDRLNLERSTSKCGGGF